MHDEARATPDRDKLAHLVRHWVEHNDGHRESYLEWRQKLSEDDLPVTRASLEKVAELTTRMNEALQQALEELDPSA